MLTCWSSVNLHGAWHCMAHTIGYDDQKPGLTDLMLIGHILPIEMFALYHTSLSDKPIGRCPLPAND